MENKIANNLLKILTKKQMELKEEMYFKNPNEKRQGEILKQAEKIRNIKTKLNKSLSKTNRKSTQNKITELKEEMYFKNPDKKRQEEIIKQVKTIRKTKK